MLNTAAAYGGMAVAPHHLAAEAGGAILREGGTAVEAMVAMAAAIAVVYPHMNAIGGDGFWILAEPGREPVGIDACGAAVAAAVPELYAGHDAIPPRGPLAALTVAGTVSGWKAALDASASWGGRLPLSRLLADAIRHAGDGIAVTVGQAALTAEKLPGLKDVPGFAETFLIEGRLPAAGQRLRQPALAATLVHLARAGLDDFYRGDVARALAADLGAVGSPLRLSDLESHRPLIVRPLSARLSVGTVYNMPPPTQGVASLMILALFERLGVEAAEGFAHVHGLVEATKQAFLVRNAKVWDPAYMAEPAERFLEGPFLDRLAARIDARRALPWPQPAAPGDTVWMGAVDRHGRAVSFIQSIYWEFGSGVVSPRTGVLWQNRGISFALEEGHPNRLAPGRRPFHTLNPALARFDDGRVMTYGTMGGEGQPQTQAAVFSRYALFGQPLQAAVTAPRWLLGRTWGSDSANLKLEGRFAPALIEALREAGHDVEVVADFTDLMGHAGAIVRHPDGRLEGAADPRSDGRVAAL
ncbi:gamma-glutamyltransferase family protein [Shumkonia mesophila]|uniref:gamma-glutamyltransferase family protein n=1 Tax=Shumkonia mesophila TaxID=2838854 RepID=UPI002934473C|nr:gamma-glutamyltransferase family protein [Shumkonia mesophila]